MNLNSVRAEVAQLMQHPRANLLATLLGVMILLWGAMSWWHWQTSMQQALMQATKQQEQLQLIISQLPSSVALVVGSDAMMATLSHHPLPSSLQGKVVDIRIVNEQLKGQINQANAIELFNWLSQLSQSGLLVSQLKIARTELGLISGSIVW
jgi:hypothetical protein